ncbi:hypothetical protein C8J42_1273 [Sphingomonas sp. PP-CE-1A-559]|uniref:hypothetical protein n=1 Tax=Sphingomonas sp. PP-CE-1A-559 TaxID=2135657 RepID=UPI0010F0C644|nr:hypothetical protein [Sphingomonas sp. PP-CE-1A-559]TCP82019.1 hypothetical protein C8J42_1273 [Sphingomonas sp. PP-CE-1A-559]
MAKPTAARFSVLPENEQAALAYLDARGCAPAKIERDVEGLTVLIFPPFVGDPLEGLAKAIPVHLSAKIGIVVGNAPPFSLAH